MKKFIFILFIGTVLILTACSENNGTSNENEANQSSANVTIINEENIDINSGIVENEASELDQDQQRAWERKAKPFFKKNVLIYDTLLEEAFHTLIDDVSNFSITSNEASEKLITLSNNYDYLYEDVIATTAPLPFSEEQTEHYQTFVNNMLDAITLRKIAALYLHSVIIDGEITEEDKEYVDDFAEEADTHMQLGIREWNKLKMNFEDFNE